MKKVELTDYEASTILDLIDHWNRTVSKERKTIILGVRLQMLIDKMKGLLDEKK